MKRFLLLFALLAVAGAGLFLLRHHHVAPITAAAADNPAGAQARLPRFSRMADGGLLMSWVEPAGANDVHVLKFSILKDGKWSPPGEAARGERWFVNWSDFPSVVAIDEKFWVAHWLVSQAGGDTYDYDIAMAYSLDAGMNWRGAGPPHRDGMAAEHGFAALFPTGGEAGVVWLDGREYFEEKDRAQHPGKSGNFALRYTTLNREGRFSEERVVDANTCTCCWPAVAVSGERVTAAWRGRTDEEIRDNRVAMMQGGAWSSPMPLGAEGWKIAGCPVNGPALAAHGDQVAAAWFTAEGDRPRVRAAFSLDGGRHFGTPAEIDDTAPLGRIGLVWRDSTTAVVSWMTAGNAQTRQSSIALRTLRPDGRLGPVVRVVNVGAGRDTGVPQMTAVAEGLLLAWAGEAPAYGVHTALVRWGQLDSVTMPGITSHNTWLGKLEICRQHP